MADRIAAIDIGTNTVLLLVAERDPAGELKVLADRHEIARLGAGVDKNGSISEEAYRRFVAVMKRHKDVIDELQVDRVIAVGTSALRDATNRDEILRRTERDLDVNVEIITGEEEARLTYSGSLVGHRRLIAPVGTLDIGGGSTELATGDGWRMDSGRSIDIGAVRITERFFETLPPSTDAMARAEAFAAGEIASGFKTLPRPGTLVAVAGTPTSLAAAALRLSAFDHKAVDGFILGLPEVEALVLGISRVTPDELIEAYPAIDRNRADILLAGSIILHETMKYLSCNEVVVSVRGLRYGVALNAFK